jgi:hypothetical protein
MSNAEKPMTLARRDFLMLGSMAVAGAAASTLSAGTIRRIAAPDDGPVLSIGFTDAFDRGGMVAARGLRFADAGFLRRGARLTVHGLWEPQPANSAPASVRVTAFFPHETDAGRLPFLAWTGTTGATMRPNRAGRVSFVAPLDDDGTLPLAFERAEQISPLVRRLTALFTEAPAAEPLVPNLAALERAGRVCRLSSGNAGDVRLRRGTYFVALRQSAHDSQPNWGAIAIDGEAFAKNGAALRQGGRPVNFTYVAISVDHIA